MEMTNFCAADFREVNRLLMKPSDKFPIENWISTLFKAEIR